MPSAPTVFLARHGQTAYNLEGRFQGQQPIPLDDTGREQAAELAGRAAGYEFAALWCSPLLRARETAEAPELFEGFFTGAPSFAFPGGESFAQQEVRVDAALCDVEVGALPALVVCHGMVIRAALSVRAGEWLPNGQRVLNGAIVPLDPASAKAAAAPSISESGDEDATTAS